MAGSAMAPRRPLHPRRPGGSEDRVLRPSGVIRASHRGRGCRGEVDARPRGPGGARPRRSIRGARAAARSAGVSRWATRVARHGERAGAGRGAYVELIAVADAAAAARTAFGRSALAARSGGARFAGWVARAESPARGAVGMSRTTPDGRTISWRLAHAERLGDGGV